MKEKIKKLAKRIFFLPPVLTILIAVPSFGLVILALTGRVRISAVQYLAYMLSAYSLVISVTGAVRFGELIKSGARDNTFIKNALAVPVIGKLVNEHSFRTEMALYPGFCINAIYVIFKTTMGIYYHSAWFVSLGVYYLALALMRFSLLHYIRFRKKTADRQAELRRYRMCGYLLFLINIALVGITVLVVKKKEGFAYPGYLIYVMATYTFYSVITAVVNLVKYRKYGSPVLSAAKVVNMSTALVALFSLETAMLTQFGGADSEHFRLIMTSLTGIGLSLIVLGMALYMVIRSSKILKNQII